MIVPEKPPWGGKNKVWLCMYRMFSLTWPASMQVYRKKKKRVLNSHRIERRSVTSRYHGSNISGWQQNQRRWRRQEERQINKMFILILQTTTLHANHAIFYISLQSLHHYDMKRPNFTSPLYGVGEHNTKIVTFFF